MNLFNYSPFSYVDGVLPQSLAWQIGIAVLFVAVALMGYHMLRRAFGPPVRSSDGEPPPASARKFERYELGARLYHWGNFAVMVLLFFTGLVFFFPGLFFPLVPYVGFTWLLTHEVLGWLFVVFVIVHILFSIFDTGLYQMWFHRGDGRELIGRTRYYLGGRDELPKKAKFNVMQKIYHAFLVIFALIMIVTGIALFLSSEIFISIDRDWLRWYRILHDIFAFLFAAVIIAHIYLRMIKPRWPEFVSMITGNTSREELVRNHDWRQWQPKVSKQGSEASRSEKGGSDDEQ